VLFYTKENNENILKVLTLCYAIEIGQLNGFPILITLCTFVQQIIQ